MTERDGLRIRAAHFGERVTEVVESDIRDAFHHHRDLLWVHVTAENPDVGREWLAGTFGFHPLEIEDALSADERPTLRVDEESLFLVAPIVILGGAKERFVEVAFFCSPHALVTVATADVGMIDHWFDRCEQKPQATGHQVSYLLHSLLDVIVDSYFPAVDSLSDEVDYLEEGMYGGKRIDIAEALGLKRRLLELRRQVTPLRDIMNGLLRRDVSFIGPDSRVYFQDVYDHTLRITEVIDMERDIFAAVLDAHLSIVSNNLNVVMRRLTVISTVLMSGAFIAGVYGMNFKHMPETEWFFGYPFAILLMGATGWLEVWYFKRKGWL